MWLSGNCSVACGLTGAWTALEVSYNDCSLECSGSEGVAACFLFLLEQYTVVKLGACLDYHSANLTPKQQASPAKNCGISSIWRLPTELVRRGVLPAFPSLPAFWLWCWSLLVTSLASSGEQGDLLSSLDLCWSH